MRRTLIRLLVCLAGSLGIVSIVTGTAAATVKCHPYVVTPDPREGVLAVPDPDRLQVGTPVTLRYAPKPEIWWDDDLIILFTSALAYTVERDGEVVASWVFPPDGHPYFSPNEDKHLPRAVQWIPKEPGAYALTVTETRTQYDHREFDAPYPGPTCTIEVSAPLEVQPQAPALPPDAAPPTPYLTPREAVTVTRRCLGHVPGYGSACRRRQPAPHARLSVETYVTCMGAEEVTGESLPVPLTLRLSVGRATIATRRVCARTTGVVPTRIVLSGRVPPGMRAGDRRSWRLTGGGERLAHGYVRLVGSARAPQVLLSAR